MVRRTVGGVLLVLALASPAVAVTTAPPSRPEPVGLGGTPVEGGPAEAPEQLAAGLWFGSLTGPGASAANTQWFAYERTMADSTVLVGVVATSPEDTGDQVTLAVTTRDGTPCGSPTTVSSDTTFPGSTFGTSVRSGLDEDGDGDTCADAAELFVAVSRGSTEGLSSSVPFALRIVEEAPVRGDLATEEPEGTTLVDPELSEPIVSNGGTSFDQAPTIDGAVSADLAQGTERLWKVHLDWGQALTYRIDVPTRPETGTYVSDPRLDVTLLGPLRTPLDELAIDAVTTGSYGTDEALELRDTTPAVTYLARYGGDPLVPGDYWISVAVSPADEQSLDVPVELTATVVGDPVEQPAFPEAVTGPMGATGPAGYDMDTPYLVEAGTFSADVSGTPTMPGDEAAADDDTRRFAGLAVGGASLLALLAGALLLRRRSRVTAGA